MSDITAIKAANDSAVTSQTAANAITPATLGARLNAITDELRGYKVYTALLNQNDEEAPVPIILENTIGDIVFSYDNSAGEYLATLAGAFPSAKVIVFINLGDGSGSALWDRQNDNVLSIKSAVNNGSLSDGLFSNGSIEIRVYP